MKKMPVVFVGHGDPMIALKINEMTETLKKVGKISRCKTSHLVVRG